MGVTRKSPTPEREKSEAAKTEVEAVRMTKAEVVSSLIEKIRQKLAKEEFKPTVGDLLRLLQLEQEMEEEQPREIRVSWIDGDKKDHASEE